MLTVCNYHYIRPNFSQKYSSIFGVTPAQFKKQLLLLKNTGDFVSPTELENNWLPILESKNNHHYITFDDGLQEQFSYAVPVLEELNILVIFFINSMNYTSNLVSLVLRVHFLRSQINSAELLKKAVDFNGANLTEMQTQAATNFYKFDDLESAKLKYLLDMVFTYDQLSDFTKLFDKVFIDNDCQAQNLYFTEAQLLRSNSKNQLGSHTHSHQPLGKLSQPELEFEMQQTISFFQQKFNKTPLQISYPNGIEYAINKSVFRTAANFGHQLGFTALGAHNTNSKNLLNLNRFDCNDLVGGKNYKS